MTSFFLSFPDLVKLSTERYSLKQKSQFRIKVREDEKTTLLKINKNKTLSAFIENNIFL